MRLSWFQRHLRRPDLGGEPPDRLYGSGHGYREEEAFDSMSAGVQQVECLEHRRSSPTESAYLVKMVVMTG